MRWLGGLCVPLLGLGGLATAFGLAAGAPGFTLALVLATLIGAPLLWFLVSTLLPGTEQRTCPACQAEALEPMDPAERYGVRCAACGHTDPDIPTARLGHEPPDRRRT